MADLRLKMCHSLSECRRGSSLVVNCAKNCYHLLFLSWKCIKVTINHIRDNFTQFKSIYKLKLKNLMFSLGKNCFVSDYFKAAPSRNKIIDYRGGNMLVFLASFKLLIYFLQTSYVLIYNFFNCKYLSFSNFEFTPEFTIMFIF